MAELNERQKMFAKEYIIDLNATQAAVRAGYSEKTARSQGQRLLTNVDIQERIQKEMSKRSKRTEITADNVLNELAHIAFDDIKEYLSFRTGKAVTGYDDDGEPIVDFTQIIEMKDSDDIDTRNIQEISMSPKDGFKFKLHDKQKALVDLGKHLRLFTERIEQTGNMNVTFVDDIGGEEDDT